MTISVYSKERNSLSIKTRDGGVAESGEERIRGEGWRRGEAAGGG